VEREAAAEQAQPEVWRQERRAQQEALRQGQQARPGEQAV